jgi:hypothetical protein
LLLFWLKKVKVKVTIFFYFNKLAKMNEEDSSISPSSPPPPHSASLLNFLLFYLAVVRASLLTACPRPNNILFAHASSWPPTTIAAQEAVPPIK